MILDIRADYCGPFPAPRPIVSGSTTQDDRSFTHVRVRFRYAYHPGSCRDVDSLAEHVLAETLFPESKIKLLACEKESHVDVTVSSS